MIRAAAHRAGRRRWLAGTGALVAGARVADASALRALDLGRLLRTLDGPDASVTVPAGAYAIDNPVVVEGRSGTLAFEPGTVLVPRSVRDGGLKFVRCDGLAVRGARLRWPTPPEARSHDGAGLLFTHCTEVEASDCEVLGAPGAGIHFENCTSVRVRTLSVAATAADGIHFANCREVSGRALSTRDTGDDGVACVDYASGPESGDIELMAVEVRDSRTRGIAIVGARRVRIDGFSVESTGSSGVLVVRDDTYRTRRPSQVVLTGGRVSGAGMRAPRVGNDFGIEAIEADHLIVRDVRIVGTTGFGLSAVRIRGAVVLEHLEVAQAGVGRSAVEVRDCEYAVLRALRIEAGDAPGLLVEACPRVRLDGLRVRAAPGRPGALVARFVGPTDVDVLAVSADGVPSRLLIDPGVSGRLRRHPGDGLRIENRGTVRIDADA